MFDIVDVSGEDVEACAQFQYKGYTISLSSIFKTKGVRIFDDSTDTYEDFNSVEDAIKQIDKCL